MNPNRAPLRALARVEFRVEFRLERPGFKRQESNTRQRRKAASGMEDEKEEGAKVGGRNRGWTEGVARWIDLRNKILYIREVGLDPDDASTVTAADEHALLPPDLLKPSITGDLRNNGISSFGCNESLESKYHPTSILNAKLLACLSAEDHELFRQLVTFCTAWKTSAAREAVDIAVEAAAQLGNVLRLFFYGVIDDLVLEVASETLAGETHDVEAAAKAEAMEAAEAAVKLAQTIDHDGSHNTSTGQRSTLLKVQIQGHDVHETVTPAPQRADTDVGLATESLAESTAEAPLAAAALAAQAATSRVPMATARPDAACRKVASLLNFKCTAIAAWVLTKKEIVGASALGFDAEELGLQGTGVSTRKRRMRRALVKLR